MWGLTFDDICRNLKERENFSFSRWGDGEWICLMGNSGKNCDGHPYFPDLGLTLAGILIQDQTHHMGMQPFAMKRHGAEISTWCKENEVRMEWCDADIIHDASIADRLNDMGVAMAGRKVILVAPDRLAQMAWRYKAAHVHVPLTNCWKWRNTIHADILDEIDKDSVILYCASMMSKVLIARLVNEYGNTITQIDIGSAFDPLCGFATRGYHAGILERIKEHGL